MEAHLKAALEATRGRMRLIALGVALTCWLAATTILTLLFVVWDHWRQGGVPPAGASVLRWAYLLASMAWIAAALVLPLVRQINDVYVARLIERANPEFRNDLVDALQIASRGDLPGSIVTAVASQAVRDLAIADVVRAVPTQRLRRLLWTLATCLALFGVYAAMSPEPVTPSVMRAIGYSLAVPTRTWCRELLPPDGTSVLQGDPVVFTARIGGHTPDTATIRFSLDGGATWLAGQELKLSPPAVPEDAWEAVKAGQDVQRTFTWQLVAGDAQSELRRLFVRPVPKVTSISARYTYPRYTGLQPTTQPGGDIDAVIGTSVTINAIANVPARDPVLVIGQGAAEHKRLLAQPSEAEPARISADLVVASDDSYCLQFSDAEGTLSRDSIRYSIRARPDNPPGIRVDAPRDLEGIAEGDPLLLNAALEDDFGLSKAAVFCRGPGQGATEIPVTIRRLAVNRASIEQPVALPEGRFQPGDVVEWWVSAWDNHEDANGSPAFQRADSGVRRLRINTPPPTATAPGKDEAADAGSESAPADDQYPESQPAGSAAPETRPATEDSIVESQPAGGGTLEDFVDDHSREIEVLSEALAEGRLTTSAPAEATASSPAESQSADTPGQPESMPGDDQRMSAASQQSTDEEQPGATKASPAEQGTGEEDGSGNPTGKTADQGSETGDQESEDSASRSEKNSGEESGREHSSDADAAGKSGAETTAGDDQAIGKAQDGNDEGSSEKGESSDDQASESGNDAQAPSQGEGVSSSKGNGPSKGESGEGGAGKEDGSGNPTGKTADQGSETGDQESEDSASRSEENSGEGSGREHSSDADGAGKSGAETTAGDDQAIGKAQDGNDEGSSEKGESSDDQASGSGNDAQAPSQGEGVSSSKGKGPSKDESGEGGAGEQDGSGNPTANPKSGGGPAEGQTRPPDEAETPDPTNPPEQPSLTEPPLRPPAGQLERLVNALDVALRNGAIDPALLQKLEWDLPRARQFVESYRRAAEVGQRQTDRSELPQTSADMASSTTGDQRVKRSGRAVQAVRPLQSSSERPPDDLREIQEPSRQRVTPRYRPLLEAYYRSLASQPVP